MKVACLFGLRVALARGIVIPRDILSLAGDRVCR